MGADNDLTSSEPIVLDIVDYQAKASSIAERDMQPVLARPRFRAAVAAYTSGLIPLGYAAFFSWDEARAVLHDNPSPDRLMDLIRYVALRHRLDGSDHRHIAIDHNGALVTFPSLFKRMDHARLKESHDEFMAEMGEFIASHPWRAAYPSKVGSAEAIEYAKYWLQSSPHRVAPLLTDRRFHAGLDSFRQGLLSYGGFIENVYGDTTRVLFPELGWHLTAQVLVQLAKAADRGDFRIPPDLRKEFPQFYEPYHPEAFGRCQRI